MGNVEHQIAPVEEVWTPDDETGPTQTEQMLAIILNDLQTPIDRPEMWRAIPQFLDALPDLPVVPEAALRKAALGPVELTPALGIVVGMCEAHTGRLVDAVDRLTKLSILRNQCPSHKVSCSMWRV